MATHILAKDILQKIIIGNVPFSLALKQTFKDDSVSKEDKPIVSALVGCALRHYLVMERVIKETYPNIESDGFIALLVAFSNALFIKKINQDDCNALAASFLKEDDIKVADFIAPYLEDKKLVPEEIEVGSFDFLSYRYNTPVSVIKMWNKQFGHVTASRILRANSKPAPTVLRINNNLISDEDFFNQYPEFEKCETTGVALYNGEGRFKNHPASEKNIVTVLPLVFKEFVDEGDVDLLRGLAIYAEYPNDLLTELLSRFNNLTNIEFMAGNYSTFINTKNALNKHTIKGINVYEANASSIITCVSKPVHTFVVMPDSSRLNLLQVLPDYFLRFNIEKLDELIANQLKALNEASNQVEDGGYLLYLVDTISKKENSGVVNEFLKDHPEFTLIKDKLYFPYKKYGGSYFYAVLKKQAKND
ncbi:MAG: hypothetical protein J6X50_00780 [Bacilli bacterium]|nr:hypothetical protein [Bacilli bacterium]